MFIADWRQSWRLWSVRVSALGAALFAVLLAAPDRLLAIWDALPPELRVLVPSGEQLALYLLLGSIAARVLRQGGAGTPALALGAPAAPLGLLAAAAAAPRLVVGPLALALMHHFEQCRLAAYLCPAGKWTIGWGMTYYPDGRKVRQGDTITQAQADAMFAQLLERDFAGPVLAAIGAAATTPAQFGAMAALAYNIGVGPRVWVPGMKQGFRQSQVLKRHVAGDAAGAAKAFGSWTKANGKVLAGLVRRRAAEAALYLSDFAALSRHTNGALAG